MCAIRWVECERRYMQSTRPPSGKEASVLIKPNKRKQNRTALVRLIWGQPKLRREQRGLDCVTRVRTSA